MQDRRHQERRTVRRLRSSLGCCPSSQRFQSQLTSGGSLLSFASTAASAGPTSARRACTHVSATARCRASQESARRQQLA